MKENELDALRKQNAALVLALRQYADRAYCQYIEQMSRDECKGMDYKMAHGKFGKAELDAHTKAAEHLGMHRGIHRALELHSIGMLRPDPATAAQSAPASASEAGELPLTMAVWGSRHELEKERMRREQRDFLQAWHGAPTYAGEWPEHFMHAFTGWMAARRTAAANAGGLCTCPSGDGSLAWPCPKHPPTVGGR